jgi:hypothetical protein
VAGLFATSCDTIVALVLSTLALVVAQFPLRSKRAKWAYVILVGIFNVAAAGSVIYATHYTLTRGAEEKTRRIALREQLGHFLAQGSQLLQQTVDKNQTLPVAEANAWADQVETYLAATLGQSYVVRFRSAASMPSDYPMGVPEERLGLWRGIRYRVINLERFSGELPP